MLTCCKCLKIERDETLNIFPQAQFSFLFGIFGGLFITTTKKGQKKNEVAVRQGSESCELSKIGHQGGKFNAASENMTPLLKNFRQYKNSKDHGLESKLTRQQIIEASYGTLFLPSLSSQWCHPLHIVYFVKYIFSRNRTSQASLFLCLIK